MRRSLLVVLIAATLGACQHGGGTATGGDRSVVFIDAAGNRMIVDVPGKEPPTGASDAAPPAAPAAVGAGAPVAGASAAGAEFSFGGETFVDVDVFEKQMDTRQDERFYYVPDGSRSGGASSQTLTRSDLAPAASVTQGAPLPGRVPDGPDVRDCGAPVRLALIAVKDKVRQDLTFPVVEEGKRYAGYLVPVPAETDAGVTVWAWIKNKKRVAVSLGLVDGEGAVLATVNNFMTESRPETMFRYGGVGGRVPWSGRPDMVAPKRVAVLDGRLVYSRLPAPCRVAQGDVSQFSPEGLVSLDFRGSTGY